MPRASRFGVRGLSRDRQRRWCIDIRWIEPSTGESRRYTERLPANVSSTAAKHRALDVYNAAIKGGFDPKRENPRRLSDLLDEYQRWADVNRPRTALERKGLAKTLQRRLGDPKLDDLSPFVVERFKRDRSAEGAKPATVNRGVAMLKHAVGLAATWGWISREKAKALRDVKLLKEPPGRVRYLSGDEEARIFVALPDHMKPFVRTALLTGMRLGEIIGLRKDAVDLSTRMITLVRTKTNRVRRIPISDALAIVLDESIRKSTCEFVFTNRAGLPWKSNTAKRTFHDCVKRTGIEDLRFHDLRHDFATKLRRNGVGIDVIAALLGHTSLAMTQRYAHLGVETLRTAVESLRTAK